MYSVGQVVYTISKKNQKVIPLKIVEQVTKKTLDGETTEYTAQLPYTNQKSLIELNRFKKVYKDISSLEKEMLENASNAIKSMISEAISLEENVFKDKQTQNLQSPTGDEEHLDKNNENKDYKKEPDNVTIDLGDGKTGKINIKNLDELLGKNEQKKNIDP